MKIKILPAILLIVLVLTSGCTDNGDGGTTTTTMPESTTSTTTPSTSTTSTTTASTSTSTSTTSSTTTTSTTRVKECYEEGDFFFEPEPPDTASCCEGLTKLIPTFTDEPIGRPDTCEAPTCKCYICTKCGNGICGKGEDWCNCPEDCPRPEEIPCKVNTECGIDFCAQGRHICVKYKYSCKKGNCSGTREEYENYTCVNRTKCVKTTTTTTSTSTSSTTTTTLQTGTIKIASWNIENFGKSKATDPVRMEIIAGILKDYDLIAVQEISNVKEMNDPGCPRNEDACPGHANCNRIRNALEQYLNQENGLNYEFVFSPQVKDERYLYIYDPGKITLESFGLVNDTEDSLPICDSSPENTGKMVRQPFRANFRAGNFDFILLTAHTSPSINVPELQGMEYFYRQVEAGGEPDIIILGDLNADCTYLRASDSIALRGSEYIWVVDDESDTTVAATDCAYDRFIFKNPTSEDYTGNWGIYTAVPDDVSDHYLVWAEFSTTADSD